MDRILALRLYGPTASWGTVEAGVERRPSTRDPGRGAILGLIAAALGFRRDETERHSGLSEGVRIAVSGHGPRRLVQDFRTVQTVEPLRGEDFPTRGHALVLAQKIHTLTGWRQHVEDGLWRVFIASAGVNLDDLAQAFERPTFELYLGRWEHPLALPPDPRLIKGGLMEALAAYPPEPGIDRQEPGDLDLRRWFACRICSGRGVDLWWDPGFPGAPDGSGRIVVDQPVSRAGWRFRSRETRWTSLSAAPSAESFFEAAGRSE